MPEGVEIEMYRQGAEKAVGRIVEKVVAEDDWFLKGSTCALDLEDSLCGSTIVGARRKGKLLVLDFLGANGSAGTVGLRFGMTGRLLVDGEAAIDRLEYSSARNKPEWDRFGLIFKDGGDLWIRDPRRLGGVELSPDETSLGEDAFNVSDSYLREKVATGSVKLKARLLDQARIAGVGNLIADEVLWRAGLDPARQAGSLSDVEVGVLGQTLRTVLEEFLGNGGSHTGKLQPARERGALCPEDGYPLQRRKIGGRTTYSCAHHQR